jgi:hypothetical protein
MTSWISWSFTWQRVFAFVKLKHAYTLLLLPPNEISDAIVDMLCRWQSTPSLQGVSPTVGHTGCNVRLGQRYVFKLNGQCFIMETGVADFVCFGFAAFFVT